MPSPESESSSLQVRPIQREDHAAWRPLWDGYNAFYGRSGSSALPEAITQATWARFFNPIEPVFALVAVEGSRLLGLAHYLFHPSTTRIGPVCYMQDLFTDPERRGEGIGRALIQAVYAEAALAGASRAYWHTQSSNAAGRALYDRVAEHTGFIVYTHEVPRHALA